MDTRTLHFQLSNAAIFIITLAILVCMYLTYFAVKHRKSQLLISWSIVTAVGILLPIIFVLSNGSAHSEELGWLVNLSGRNKLLGAFSNPGDATFSVGGIIVICMCAFVVLSSLILSYFVFADRKTYQLTASSNVVMGVILAFSIFVLLFLFAGTILETNAEGATLFHFWFTGGVGSQR